MCDALITARWWSFLDRSLQEAKIHLQMQQEQDSQVKQTEPRKGYAELHD